MNPYHPTQFRVPMPTPPPPVLPPILNATVRDVTCIDASDANAAPSLLPTSRTATMLWENLKRLPPERLTLALGRPPASDPSFEMLGGVYCSASNVPIEFGRITVATAALGAAVKKVAIINTGIQPVRVTDIFLKPGNVPFRAAHPPAGFILKANSSIDISVIVDMKAPVARGETQPWNSGFVQFWCIAAFECAAVPALLPPTCWVVHGRCVGAELRADIASWRETARQIKLDANAEPFFPSEFKKCFEKEGRASLPTICDHRGVDALIPEGMRRVVDKAAGVCISCPSRAQRESGLVDYLRGNIVEDAEAPGHVVDGGESAPAIEPGQFSSDDAAVESSRRVLPSELESFDSYKGRLSLGLHLEAEQSFVDMKRYDIIETVLIPVSRSMPLHVSIRVPGLSESRPALVLLDPVRLRPTHRLLFETTELIARVTNIDILGSTVTVKLPEACVHQQPFEELLTKARDGHGPFLMAHVRFCVGHTFASNCLMQRVVQTLAPSVFERLRRAPPIVTSLTAAGRAEWVRKLSFAVPESSMLLCDLNTPQLEAVFMSVGSAEDGVDSSIPLLIFGPPGCGKTRTLSAAILLALLKHGPDARILAVAPSHEAADVLCERLSEGLHALHKSGALRRSPRSTLFRLNAYERAVSTARASTLRHAHQSGAEGFFDLPVLEQLEAYNIVVSTCASVELLAELPSTHFSAGVFCDESAQALQPEALIPLNRFARDPDIRIVLAGDPHQLNASVRSKGAARLGLHISLIEDLMAARKLLPGRNLYNVHLRVNYRVRHPALLELPNKLFYDDLLVTRSGLPVTSVANDLQDLFPSGIPIMFAGLSCPEERVSERSPGFVNVGEAAHITSLCQRVTAVDSAGRRHVRPDEITVICPYRAQVIAVRKLLREEGLDSVKVGSVSDTQGQQNVVVIVSLTVSSEESIGSEDSRLEGITSPKKFNVAVTRAMEMLIVVGNPSVFRENPYWGTLLRYAVRRGCYRGVSFQGMEDMAAVAEIPDEAGGGDGEGTAQKWYSLFQADRVEGRQPLLALDRVRETNYDSTMQELTHEGDEEEESYEVSQEELEAAFREEDDRPWRVML